VIEWDQVQHTVNADPLLVTQFNLAGKARAHNRI
jgi:hypothetical protein